MDIMDLPSAWRKSFMPANYRGAGFYVESGGPDSGRRIALHEFPKRDVPYAEDMGKRATRFTVRAYCIQSARQPDYRQPRNALRSKLEQIGSGQIQLPFIPPFTVVCERYKLTEEDKYGGYRVFDISVVEAGGTQAVTQIAAVGTQSASVGAKNAIVAQIAAGPRMPP
jgi:prophage DNA circulation protein